ncbi:MAG: methionine transporter ATP-binding protein [Frankiales bacterium]|nr:methionine transporter ATP-binding protein [Frankiales bacterium]
MDDRSKHPTRSLLRILGYLRPYRGPMALMTAAAVLATAASLFVPIVTQHVVDGPVSHHDRGGLIPLGLLALALGVAEAALVFVRRWTQAYLALGMETAVRDDLYQHLQRLPVSFHDKWQSGQLLSRATSDLSQIRRFLSFGLVFLFVNIATFVTVVVLLVRINTGLGLLVALAAVPLFLVSRSLSRSYMAVARKVQDQQGDLATYIEESAVGVRTIRSFGRAGYVGTAFRTQATTLHDTAVEKAGVVSRFWSTFDLIPSLTLSVVLLLGARSVAAGHLTLGELVAFVTLMLTLSWPIDSLGFILANGQEAMTAADRIYEVLDTRSEVLDGPLTTSEGPGALTLQGVGFTYPGASAPVLHEIDLEVRPGETMALVGVTGSGKTTLTALVPRLYDVTAGRILLDGVDVRDLTLPTLRTRVATAFEEPTLFSASVRENITLGRPAASEEDVLEALEIAQADFVHDLPWGLDTRIGEQGLSLSGGQRQRLALARAVLGRPDVLVLDDPLSALDVQTEALVEEALHRILQGTTALLVVHRPSTIALADRVAFLEGGTLVAVGTHAELLGIPAYRAVLSADAEVSA